MRTYVALLRGINLGARNKVSMKDLKSSLTSLGLERAPAAKARSQLDRERSPPDRFSVRGREIYLHVPNGFGRSKLALEYFERRLGVEGTVRNWRTVTRLLALADRRGP